ncbi:hypothetical protein [Bizionia sp.]|uniref:hypothetical protein n=1 Tax=Bizionia sp. TaxID=1954480 RepID=UPI003A90CBAA
MIKKLTFIGICFLLANCASLPKYESNDLVKLTENNISQINGIYSNFAENKPKYSHLSFSGKLTSDKLKDSISKFEIELLNDKKIRFSFLDNKDQINSKIIKYKIQDNGFLFLKNKNFRLHGIPYILGDYEIRKFEIGINNTGNLIMNGVTKRDGAIFIIIWGPPGGAIKFTNIYKTE